MVIKKFIYLVLSVFFLSGCSAVTVHHEGTVPQNLSEAKATYSWLDQSIPSNDFRVNNPTIQKLVHNSVEKQLAKMGYLKTETNADYLITWFGNIEEEVKEIYLASFYRSYGYSTLIGEIPKNAKGGKIRKVFSRGTLIIDVLDRDSKRVIWRGSATNTLRDEMNKSQLRQYLNTSVEKIFERLPR